MEENFKKRQSDVMEDLRSMRSELKNLLVKYPEDDELEVELYECRRLIDLKVLNNMKWVETCEGWLKEMKKELAKKFSNEELICYCFEKEVFPELVE
jgi:hypothetical protein